MAKTKETGVNPAGVAALVKGDFENAAVAFTPGGIEAQEAQGQKELVNSNTIPVECNCDLRDVERIGIKYLIPPAKAKLKGDLFIEVELPPGWKKVPTDHSMWSNLVDDEDRVRANIFYKAAFYDKSAHINLVRRFDYGAFPEDFYKSNASYEKRQKMKWAGVVKDYDDRVIFNTEWITLSSREKDHFKRAREEEEMGEKALAWLNKHYPDWKDYAAYWD